MSNNDDFLYLVDFLHDELTAAECDALISRLKAEPQLAAELLTLATDECYLTEIARSAMGQEASNPTEHSQIPFASRPRGFAAIAAAAMILLAAGVIFWSGGLPWQSPPKVALLTTTPIYIARVTEQSEECRWYVENRGQPLADQICAGETVRVNAGELTLEYEHGTVVTLQAPAIFELQDTMHSRVHLGGIRARIAKGAEGFSVITPMARVIDQGTEFGVNVNDRGSTDVAVFSGAVDVESGADRRIASSKPQRLITGEAMRLDETGTMSRIVTITDGRFPQDRSRARRPSTLRDRPPIIVEVRDNIKRNDNFKFYEIVLRGMCEDARAFVDREFHEWNGIDERGMPDILLGGDYVKLFNDDKLNQELDIAVTIAQPSMFYILLDDRVSVPAWLAEDFELTEYKIGLDVGPFSESKRQPGVGPGNSIDDIFSIWQRRVTTPEVIHLGAIQSSAPPDSKFVRYLNIYGIVAVPLENL